MTKADHPANDLLLRVIDDELPAQESVMVESHVSQCEACRNRYRELRLISTRVESLVAAVVVESSLAERECLAENLGGERSRTASQSSERVLRRFGWGMAIAATLALGITLFPDRHAPSFNPASPAKLQAAAEFEVDGETFMALPYSNPELPVSVSRIVEMQVPVSSLTDAGIIFEPVAYEVAAPDRSVLADVLLGMDGQPLGVHVVAGQ